MPAQPLRKTLEQALWISQNSPIRLFGDPVLNKKCQMVTVKEIKSGTAQKWANEMVDFLKQYRRKFGVGRGLAANQIGINKRLVVVWLADDPVVYLNPKIVSKAGRGVYPESCISAAGLIIGDIKRAWTANFGYVDLEGNKQFLKANQIQTRLLLHEIDHLNGRLCSDYYIKGTVRLATGNQDEILKSKLKKIA